VGDDAVVAARLLASLVEEVRGDDLQATRKQVLLLQELENRTEPLHAELLQRVAVQLLQIAGLKVFEASLLELHVEERVLEQLLLEDVFPDVIEHDDHSLIVDLRKEYSFIKLAARGLLLNFGS